MASKIVALVVVALALANAAPRDMSKLDNQVLEDKISEILSSSELIKDAQESPDWMVEARRSNSTTYTMTQTMTISLSGSYSGTTKTSIENGYAYTVGIASSSFVYYSGCSLSSSSSRRATVAFSAQVSSSRISAAQSNANSIASDSSTFTTNVNAASGGTLSVTVSNVGTASSSANSTSGAAQLTFGIAALLAALFAHLF